MKHAPSRLILFWLVALTGCWASSPTRPPVQHVVICWLKHPGDPAARAELIKVSKGFARSIPGIRAVSAGPVLESARPAVDSSFDVAIVMTFDDEASLAAYGQHPKHLQAVEETLKPLVARYVIYDFVEE
jgi:hypothetical protein